MEAQSICDCFLPIHSLDIIYVAHGATTTQQHEPIDQTSSKLL